MGWMYCNEVYDGYLKSYDIMLLLTVIQDYVLCDKRGTVKDYGLDVNEVYTVQQEPNKLQYNIMLLLTVIRDYYVTRDTLLRIMDWRQTR